MRVLGRTPKAVLLRMGRQFGPNTALKKALCLPKGPSQGAPKPRGTELLDTRDC